MDTRRMVVLPGVMVASAVEWSGNVNAFIGPEDGMSEEGGGESRASTCGARYRLAKPGGALSQMWGSCERTPE